MPSKTPNRTARANHRVDAERRHGSPASQADVMSTIDPETYAPLQRELAEARAYQAAIDEVLHLVGASPSDL